MAGIEIWLEQPAARAIGWALLQFVWQGAAVGMLTALALLALRRSASDVRYVIASIGLALMMTLPVVTGVQKYEALRAQADRGVAVFTNGVLVGASGERLKFDRLEYREAPEPAPTRTAAPPNATRSGESPAIMPLFLIVWSAGVMLLTLRLLTGWLWVQRLRTRGVTAAAEGIRQSAARLGKRLHITRTVTLLESALVDVPTVIGFLAPVVLLPASALAGLTAQQLEAILAHELAHIRRHDYLVNLLQTLVETVLFYHPAVWWLSRRIRIERENCCDDLAVSLCGDPVAYATALADLEAMRLGPSPDRRIALAATGGSLLHRVRRLLGAPSSHSGRGPAWLAGGVALLLVGGIVLGADGAREEPIAVSPQAPARAAATTLQRMSDVLRRAAPSIAIPFTARARASTRATLASIPTAGLPSVEPPASVAAAAAPTGPAAAAQTTDVPVPPAAVVPAVAPAAAEPPHQTSISQTVHDSTGNWIWSNNGERLEVSYSGSFEFSDDDTDVRQVSAGGWIKISDGRWLGRHSVEIRERGGSLERRYYVNTAERAFEPEGRAWLRDNLPKFVRSTGIGADGRVARLLKSGGPAAVMTEIGRIDSTYVKGIYFKQLFKQAPLTAEQYRQAMGQASREMRSSSYELAQMLIAAAENLPNDETSRAAYFQAAGVIDSDYELRRVYSTMLKRGPVSSSTLGGILANVKSIDSDYELSELLRQILSQQPLDDRNRAAFFAAVSTIDSAYERHRVLSSVVSGQRASDPALLEAALAAATRLQSNYETSTFLQEVLRQNGVEGAVRGPFFAALNTIDSDYERGRVLQAVVTKSGTSDDTLRAALQSARTMSGYELSQLLQLIARGYSLGGDLRDAYVSAADRLGGYEQSQALAALVRSERRK